MSPSKAPKTSSKKSPKVENETVAHYNAILLEDIQSKMELVIEGMGATRTELKNDMQQMEARLSADINMLKVAVTAHSGEIKELKTAVTAHSGEIKGLKTEVSGLKVEIQRLDAKIDGVDQHLSQVEQNLSDKLDHQSTRLDDHENRITVLEKAADS